MKPSTLASYLESLAGLIRASKPTGESLPTIKAHTRPRPTLEVTGTRVAGPLPIPTLDADASTFLSACLPGLTRLDQANANYNASASELEAMAAKVRDAHTTIGKMQTERESLKQQVASMSADLEALRRTVDRMRVAPSVTVAPAPAQKPAPAPVPTGDLINAILDDYSPKDGPAFETIRPRPHFTITPLVLAFPPNHQGKVLAAASIALDEVRALFSFRFIDPKDATKGGYWLAKDPLNVGAQTLARDLCLHGAFVRDQIPA